MGFWLITYFSKVGFDTQPGASEDLNKWLVPIVTGLIVFLITYGGFKEWRKAVNTKLNRIEEINEHQNHTLIKIDKRLTVIEVRLDPKGYEAKPESPYIPRTRKKEDE